MIGPVRRLAAAAYGTGLRALYSDIGFPWSVHGEIVRIHPDARHLVPHEAEPELFRCLKASIWPGDAVLDVGAFVGIYAVLEARWAGRQGRVVAFEPTPSSARLAREHIGWNAFGAARVHLIEAAAADRPSCGTLYEYDAAGLPYANSLAAAADTNAAGSPRDVAIVTIDDVCRELGVVPSLIRMDVQGAELRALLGARQTIRTSPRLTLIVEMHPQCWPAFGITEEDVRCGLDDLGLRARPLVDGEPLFGRDTHAVLTPATP